jgi:hypothetical protein
MVKSNPLDDWSHFRSPVHMALPTLYPLILIHLFI